MLIQGDAIIEMRKLVADNIKVDCIIVDPPYGTTRCKWDSVIDLNEMWDCINNITNDNAPILIFSDEPFTSVLISSNLKYFKYRITWDKVSVTNHLNANSMPMKQTEDICVFYKKPPNYKPIKTQRTSEEELIFKQKFTGKEQNNEVYGYAKGRNIRKDLGKYPSNLIRFNSKTKECNGRNRVHPTQKPVDLLEYLIKTYTNKNDIVLDFTMGSGSTGVACTNLNREFVGIELDTDYFNIAKGRIHNEYGL